MITFQRSALMVLFLAIVNLSLQSQDLRKYLPESLPEAKVNQLLRPGDNHQKNVAADPVLQHSKDSVKYFTYADPNNPICETLDTYEYDAWGSLILYTEYYWHGSHAVMVPSSKDVYAYNMEGLLIIDTTFTWQTDSDEWREYQLFEYQYNSAGKEDYFQQYEWDSQADDFVNDTKIETSYDANDDLEVAVISRWNTGLSTWENSFRSAYTYNSNHAILTMLSFFWDDGLDDWVSLQRQSYEYDAEENNTVIICEFWDQNLSKWDKVQKMEMEYNSKGQKEIEQDFAWHFGLSQWDPVVRYEYLYHEDGKMYAQLYMPWDEGMGTFLTEFQTGYTYDPYGNQIVATTDTIDKIADEMVLCLRIYDYYSHLYHVIEYETICDQDSLEWQDSYLKAEGMHTASYSSVQGYDSLHSMYLFINPKPEPFSISGAQSVAPGQIEIYTVPANADVNYSWYIINCTPLSYPDRYSIEIEWGSEGESYIGCVSSNEFECRSDQIKLVVDVQNTAIPEDLPEGLSFYPNPVQSHLHLVLPEQHRMKHIQLFDVMGRSVLKVPVNENKMSLEVGQLSSGIYILSFEGENSFQQRIIKQ